jgi:hypothetical protein
MGKAILPSLPTVAELVQLLQTAFPMPMHWQNHVHNLGLSSGWDLAPEELARVTERVFWMVPQMGIKDPAAWLANRRRLDAANASTSRIKKDAALRNARELQVSRPQLGGAETSAASLTILENETTRVEPLSPTTPELAESAQLAPRIAAESTYVVAGPKANGKTSHDDDRKVSQDTGDGTALISAFPEACQAPLKSTSRAIALTDDFPAVSVEVELLPRAEAVSREADAEGPEPCLGLAGRDIEQPKAKCGPVEATASNQGHSDARRRKQRGRPPDRLTHPKAGGMLSPERMLIVIESLKEKPIYRYAAEKAGIHRRTLEYWLKGSKAGNDRYDIKWQGFTLPFHEHCETAINIAHDKLLTSALEIARGVRIRMDENGKSIQEVVGPLNGKMIRFCLELARPERWGKYPDMDNPPTGGVLVLGDANKQHGTYPSASIKARQWTSGLKKVTKP